MRCCEVQLQPGTLTRASLQSSRGGSVTTYQLLQRVQFSWRRLLDGNDHDFIFLVVDCGDSAGGCVTLRVKFAPVQAGNLSRALAFVKFDHEPA